MRVEEKIINEVMEETMEYIFSIVVKTYERELFKKADETKKPKDISIWYRFYCRYQTIIDK